MTSNLLNSQRRLRTEQGFGEIQVIYISSDQKGEVFLKIYLMLKYKLKTIHINNYIQFWKIKYNCINLHAGWTELKLKIANQPLLGL